MKRLPSAALVVAVTLCAFLPASAQKKAAAANSSGDILPFKATEKTLPNGLKIIVVPTGFPNIVSLRIPVQTGSRNEVEPGKSGFAHFFEHVMFRGTKTMTKEQANDLITKAGARENASTSDDYTNYYITFAKEDLESMIRLQADRFQNLSYTEEDFKTEARAVLGEYNKNSASPGAKLREVIRDNAFTTHTYKHTTMGFIRDIENMPTQFEYSKTFFDRWYRPERTTILVAGDVTPAEVIPLVEKYWGNWKRGTFSVTIPKEPPPTGPKYAHVPWSSPTLPFLALSFRNPAFSETNNDNAALDMVATLFFGPTSELFKKLVQREQKVDGLGVNNSRNVDPELFTISARVKKAEDIAYVRDEMLKTVAKARATRVSEKDLAEAKSNFRYSFVRSLDNTDRIGAVIGSYVYFNRSYNTLNRAYALYSGLTPADLQRAARTYFVDNGLVVGTLASGPLPTAIAVQPKIASFETDAVATTNGPDNGATPAAAAASISANLMAGNGATGTALAASNLVIQRNPLAQLRFKLVFNTGSANDPAGKEGLAALASSMIARAGSKAMTLEQINKALYPMAGSFGNQVDKELTTFTGSIHRDNWRKFVDITLPMLLDPAFRETDFKRVKDAQINALRQDLRSANEEELGKERLQTNIFRGTPYGHTVLGTIAGLEAITLDDVKQFVRNQYTRGNLVLGINGDVPQAMIDTFQHALMALPAGTPAPGPSARPAITATRPTGMEVEIIEKDTRATAISFGLPITVTRAHSDFAALSVARAWLGEHRMSTSHLYDRIRNIRGMNYGDYAYIEAFPRGMFEFYPDPNIPRRAQIFEVWIRPVEPQNAHMALRIATNELEKLINDGLSEDDFQATRQYLMKNVYVMTATQDQQIGYALDSKWYGIPEYTSYMRSALQKLTRDDVNRAIKKHLSAKDVYAVIITKDAAALRDALVADAFSPIKYDAEKPADLLAEDKVIGARKLGIAAEKVKITPVEEVFAR
ncbi:MAG: insulinase family protein [Gemmatimonadota bacterium]|nr:insulinase family protein [Gemmatimonadota bacterium]